MALIWYCIDIPVLGRGAMTTNTFVLPITFAQLWVESSVQVMRATGEFWSGVLGSAPSARPTSTASPWWMAPQQMRAHTDLSPWSAAFGTWMPGTSPLLPWLPTARGARTDNPFALWQQMWLNAAGAGVQPPWPANNSPVAGGLWQPVAAAYRTANGHAMAAVLRTMADVVEPKARGFTPAHYWPSTLGAHH
jgi:hypothetical protein